MKRIFHLPIVIMFFLITHIFAHHEEWPWAQDAKDGDELKFVESFLPDNPIILEAGAHRGEDTRILANKWPRGTVYAFEPCPEYYKELARVVSSLKNVHIYPYALFSSAGKHQFYMSMACDGASSLYEDTYGIGYKDVALEVDCMNLDEWATDNNVQKIDYMWLDMEGAEYTVLSAAPKILSTVRVISLEGNCREFRKGFTLFDDLKNFLEESGFYLYKVWGSPTWQVVAIFIRNDAHAA